MSSNVSCEKKIHPKVAVYGANIYPISHCIFTKVLVGVCLALVNMVHYVLFF